MNEPPDTLLRVCFVLLKSAQHAYVSGNNIPQRECVSVCVSRGKGGEQSSTQEALSGVAAQGLPWGTARLEKPSAGLQLNKRWEGSVSLEGQQHWEALRLNAEDKQMLE